MFPKESGLIKRSQKHTFERGGRATTLRDAVNTNDVEHPLAGLLAAMSPRVRRNSEFVLFWHSFAQRCLFLPDSYDACGNLAVFWTRFHKQVG